MSLTSEYTDLSQFILPRGKFKIYTENFKVPISILMESRRLSTQGGWYYRKIETKMINNNSTVTATFSNGKKCLFDFYVKREYSEKLPMTLVECAHLFPCIIIIRQY